MPQPIPSNSIRPLTVGEKVRILPKFQDPGDDEFERVVVEAPDNSPRVLIRTLIPDMTVQPTETIEAAKLERVIDLGPYRDMPPETVIEKHLEKLSPELRFFLVEKFPDEVMATGKFTNEEANLCARLHPGIALRRAADKLADDQIRQLSETHSFSTLLYASHRLQPDELRQMTAIYPGECIIILERHPESNLRFSLRALNGRLNPKVEQALRRISQPGG